MCNAIDHVYFLKNQRKGKKKFNRLKVFLETLYEDDSEILKKTRSAENLEDLYRVLPDVEITKTKLKLNDFKLRSAKSKRPEHTESSVFPIYTPTGGANKKY